MATKPPNPRQPTDTHPTPVAQSAAAGKRLSVAIMAATFPEIEPTIAALHLVPLGPYFTAEGQGMRVTVCVSGIGPTNAAAALIRLLDVEKANLVISAGFAGGLMPDLRIGDALEPLHILNQRGDVAKLAPGSSAEPQMLFGLVGQKPRDTLLSLDKVVTTAEQKTRLFQSYPAAAVDMESFQLAKVSHQLKLPFRALRVISDDARTSLPPEAERWVTADGRADSKQAMRDILRKPWRLPAALKLAHDAKTCSAILAERLKDMLRREAPPQHPRWNALD
jgi:adenosylhomocysteine nucleosidase